MNKDLPLMMLSSARNVFKTNLTNKAMSDYCGVSFTTISELRAGKRSLLNTSFRTVSELYRLSREQNVNQERLESKNQLGRLGEISLTMKPKKLFVSQHPYDLLAHGFLGTRNFSPLTISCSYEMKLLNIYNSVFVDEQDNVHSTYKLNHTFNCGYGGHGPNNLVRFLSKYSTIPVEELMEVIFLNDVVLYDFIEDTIEGYESKTKDMNFHLYTADSRLLVLFGVDDYETFLYEKDNRIEKIANDISRIEELFSSKYSLDINLKEICYVFRSSSEETKKYASPTYGNKDYHIILKYEHFEIWLPYSIGGDGENVFENPVLSLLVGGKHSDFFANKKRKSKISKQISKAIGKPSFPNIVYFNHLS